MEHGRRLMRASGEGSVSLRQGKWPDQSLGHRSGRLCWKPPAPRFGFQGSWKFATIYASPGIIWGIVAQYNNKIELSGG